MYLLRFIGNIASGKTTLKDKVMAMVSGIRGISEPVEENVLLKPYYIRPDVYAFPVQAYMEHYLWRRLRDLVEVENGLGKKQAIVTDYGVTACFTNVLHKKQRLIDAQEHLALSNLIRDCGQIPGLTTEYVYLDVTPEECYKRLCYRNRTCETTANVGMKQYLHDLGYEYTLEVEKRILEGSLLMILRNGDISEEQLERIKSRLISHQ